MNESAVKQGTIAYLQDDYLLIWADAFLIDRKAQNMSKGTLEFYRKKLKYFTDYCDTQAVKQITQITPTLLREFLLDLENKGHNSGGIHAVYRTIKTFLRWWENEVEPDDWKNPIKKVKPPKVNIELLEPANIDDVYKMIDSCKDNITGKRDKALMLFLLDTGVRASEVTSISLEDINLITGEVIIKLGKGKKDRQVYLGSKTRKALRAYMKLRSDSSNNLWIRDDGERLTYWGLKMIMKRRSKQAKVKTPQLHAFRRWFALTCLRTGMNVYSLQELMGHADLQVLRRYLKQTNQDIREAHQRASPVDNI
ncbi:MAG: tyrosine-type recombinase/integrase [Anaerolineales bacterium]|nr:tyrosine-type recombinase/integrase [Anaerolineales bacterium]